MQRHMDKCYRLFVLLLAVLLVSACGTVYPRKPQPLQVNENILEVRRFAIPQFFEILEFEFSPDKSKVAVVGSLKEYDSGKLDPEVAPSFPDTLMVLEWPSLVETYRYDVHHSGESDIFYPHWAPDGHSVYMVDRLTLDNRMVARVDLPTGKRSAVPFPHLSYAVSPDGQYLVAWARMRLDAEGEVRWVWTDELFVFDAVELTPVEVIRLPGIQEISQVYTDRSPDRFLIVSSADCHDLLRYPDGTMIDPDPLYCDNTLYRFSKDSGELSLLLAVGSSEDVRMYNIDNGLLIEANVSPGKLQFMDVNAACLVLELDWDWRGTIVQWYDKQFVAEYAGPTFDHRIPEIRLYRIRELVTEGPLPCLAEGDGASN